MHKFHFDSLCPIISQLNLQTTNNIVTSLTNCVNNQSLIPSTGVVQLALTLKVTTAQVVKMSVTVSNNSPIQDYVHPDDHAQPTYEMTHGLKYFTIIKNIIIKLIIIIIITIIIIIIIIIIVLMIVMMMISEVNTLLFNISIQHHSW